MKNTFTTPADFWQERDFGAKISAVFEFIGAHWRPLGKCLVYFVLPGALLMGVGLGLFTNSFFNGVTHNLGRQQAVLARRGPTGLAGLYDFSGLGLAFLGGTLAFLLLIGTLHAYLRARLRLPATEPVPPAEVWAELRVRGGRMLRALALLMGTYLVVALGAVIVIGTLGAGLAGSSLGAGVVFIGMAVFYFLFIYLAVAMSLFFTVLWLEDLGVFATIGRCFYLIKGRWWATFGLLAVVIFLQSMLTIVFALPQYGLMMGKLLHLPGLGSEVLGLLAQCFYAVGIVFTYTIPLLALVFQYYNLVEQKDGLGLRLLVGQLGQPQAAPVAQSGHYRPSEEGEY